jgi:hypothetical protein
MSIGAISTGRWGSVTCPAEFVVKVAPSTVTLAPETGLSVSPETMVRIVPFAVGVDVVAGGADVVVGVGVGAVGPPSPPPQEIRTNTAAVVIARLRIRTDFIVLTPQSSETVFKKAK